MHLTLVCTAERTPRWVTEGFEEYRKRLPPEIKLFVKQAPLAKRTKSSHIPQVIRAESENLLKTLPQGSHIIALDRGGKSWSTEDLAEQMTKWQQLHPQVSLLLGGPNGLSEVALSAADGRWSLSALTFPHPLVKLILAEQIYRASTILQGHPYHK